MHYKWPVTKAVPGPEPWARGVRRIRLARDNFTALLEENSERGLLRLSHARELLETDPRWKVRPPLPNAGLSGSRAAGLHVPFDLLPAGRLCSFYWFK